MNSSASLCLGCCAFFLGSAFGCVLCAVSSKIFGKRMLGCRLSLFCMSITFAVAFFAAMMISAGRAFSADLLLESRVDMIFVSALFAFGTALSALWKILLVPSVISYAVLCAVSFSFLGARFPVPPERIPVSVGRAGQVVRVRVYRIDRHLLVPVRRFFCEVVDDGAEHTIPVRDGFPGRMLSRYKSWLVSDFEEIEVELPPSRTFPALYILKFESDMNDFCISAIRTL